MGTLTRMRPIVNTRVAAGALLALGVLYGAVALATGHSASAVPPPDLAPAGAGLSVWKSLALLSDQGAGVAVLDVRPADQFRLYQLPGSVSVPGGDAGDLARAARGKSSVLVVAGTDARASKAVARLGHRGGAPEAHYLSGGVRAWYLALELPVPVFSATPPPAGYGDALATVRGWLAGERRPGAAPEAVRRAIARLATADYQPTELQDKKKPAAGGKRKKIAGGCG